MITRLESMINPRLYDELLTTFGIVDDIHVHGGFLAEEGGLVVGVDVCAVPASVSKRYSA